VTQGCGKYDHCIAYGRRPSFVFSLTFSRNGISFLLPYFPTLKDRDGFFFRHTPNLRVSSQAFVSLQVSSTRNTRKPLLRLLNRHHIVVTFVISRVFSPRAWLFRCSPIHSVRSRHLPRPLQQCLLLAPSTCLILFNHYSPARPPSTRSASSSRAQPPIACSLSMIPVTGLRTCD